MGWHLTLFLPDKYILAFPGRVVVKKLESHHFFMYSMLASIGVHGLSFDSVPR